MQHMCQFWANSILTILMFNNLKDKKDLKWIK